MTATNSMREALARLKFANEVAVGGAFEALGSGLRNAVTAGDLWISMHTQEPLVGGAQTAFEAGFGAYARQSLARAWGAGGWDNTLVATGIVSNTGVVTFPVATSAGSDITYVGIGTDETGAGFLLDYTPMGLGLDPKLFTQQDAQTANTILAAGHNLQNDDRVMFLGVIGGTLPTPLDSDVAYYVINRTDDTFQVSLTASPGSAIDLGDGAAHVYKVNPAPITIGTQVSFAAGQLVFKSE